MTRTIAAAVFAATTTAFAAPITVLNPSFETFNPLNIACPGTDCAYNVDTIPDWGGGPFTGSFRPGNNSLYFNSIPDGNIVAYVFDGELNQTVSETVQLGVTYTLQVDIGERKDRAPGGVAYLVIGTEEHGPTGPVIPEGEFRTYTATYTGVAADVGKSIRISLRQTFANGTFDNVRLSNSLPGPSPTPIPEPSSIALTGVAAGCLAAVRKLRRQ